MSFAIANVVGLTLSYSTWDFKFIYNQTSSFPATVLATNKKAKTYIYIYNAFFKVRLKHVYQINRASFYQYFNSQEI